MKHSLEEVAQIILKGEILNAINHLNLEKRVVLRCLSDVAVCVIMIDENQKEAYQGFVENVEKGLSEIMDTDKN